MAETLNTGGDDTAKCKICSNYFDSGRHTPKSLGSSHTFCQVCLGALHSREDRGWRIGCPVCPHRTPVPEYRVHNLPDNTSLTEALPLNKHVNAPKTEEQTSPAVSSATSRESNDSCHTCKHVAFCVRAIFSFLSMMVLLFLGLFFVDNFNNSTPLVGPVCLFVGSVLALFWLIHTWLMYMLKYRPETEAGHFSSPNIM